VRILRRTYAIPAAVFAAVALTAGLVVALPGAKPAGAVAAIRHDQVITIRATSATATTAAIEAWQLQPNGVYLKVFGPFTAHVGAAGIGTAREGSTKTPAGVWWLTQSFGIAPNPGSGLRYFKVDNLDWWNGDSASRYYNQHQRCAPGTCPFDEKQSEHLLSIGAPYNYAVLINYNTGPVKPGAGSAFFLHVTNNRPTGGCVAIPQVMLIYLMRWMRSMAHPLISIGVGDAAYAPIPKRRR
jgi:L,D-peptidoglycan transpeptidase YkuD (ErfK/YbiS/YcfS/YnhG family)